MRYAAIIVAAGRGTRAGGPLPKQWQEIAGKPVARWTLERFSGAETRVLVIHPDDRERAEAATDGLQVRLVPGGQSRDDSVHAGLEALTDLAPDCVLIHDAARPCVTDTVIEDTLAALETSPGAAPALAVTDALWTGAEDRVTGTHPREGLYRAQTPQGFHYDAILAAHRAHDGPAPDDVEVARAAGLAVAIVPGSEDNLKITGPGDLARAAAILERRYGYPAR